MSFAGVLLNTSSQVGEPLMPSLFSIRRTFTVSSCLLSTRKSDNPRPSVVPSSERAKTSLMCASPLVIKRFTPFRYHIPSFSLKVAFSCTACKSEPASGSVKSIEQVCPSQTLGRNSRLISSSANSLMVSAQSCKPQILAKPASARETISAAIT